MDLLQLHAFRTVARLDHVTRAAEELRVAQPALSKTIARLEAELGVPLFDRRGRRVALNTCGRAFLRHVERVFMALEDGRHCRVNWRSGQWENGAALAHARAITA